MFRRLLVLFCALSLSSVLLSQGSPSKNAPIKYRLLMTSVTVEDVNKDEIAITLNAFNTGRQPIDFSSFNSVPKEMEIKFEESFYRSNLSDLEEDIVTSMMNKNITINNGKILKNLRFNLPCTEGMYKELTKKEKRFTKNYTPRSKSNAPTLKYKTAKKKASGLANVVAKKKKKKSKKVDITDARKEMVKADTKVNAPKINSPKVKEPVIKKTKVNTPDVAITEKKVDTPKVKKPKVDVNPSTEIKTTKAKVKEPTVAVDTPKRKDTSIPRETPKNTRKQNVDVVSTEKKRSTVFEKQKQKKKEIENSKKDSFKIEQASQKEDEKAILESLGVGSEKKKTKKNNSTAGKVAFDTKAGVEASKNSYAERSVCPDMVLEKITIIKKNSKWVTLEYTLTNVGKGPAYLGKDSNNQNLALRAFLSSSENLSRGSLPLGGGFVNYDNKENQELYPEDSFTGTLKLDIRKMTKFTPFVILNFDPFNVLDECTKTNNYGQIKVGG